MTEQAIAGSGDENLTVSVIITTHSWGRYGSFRDAIRSVERQDYNEVELVCPVDSDEDMADATQAIADGGLTVDYLPQGSGLAEARNRGAAEASGDVYAFLDDDCIAPSDWVETLVNAFEDGAMAAGGPARPDFPGGRPWYIPEQWDWLVGAGPYHETECEVRNTYGCNIAFRADVFDSLGGFDAAYGKDGDLTQGEETELCARMREKSGAGVRYLPDAAVEHRVFPEQLTTVHLLHRAYYQGMTKRKMGLGDEETGFLADVLRSLATQSPHKSMASLAYTAATGMGYLRGGA